MSLTHWKDLDCEHDWSRYYKSKHIGDLCRTKADRHKVYFDSIAHFAQKGNILEIGSGSGACMLCHFHLHGLSAYSIDVSYDMAKLARKNILTTVPELADRVIVGHGNKIPFSANSFMIAFSQGVLEHFEIGLIKSFVTEGLRVAKYFAFSVPTVNFTDKYHLLGNEILLSKEEWESLICEFTICKSQYYSMEEEYFAVLKR